MLLRWVAHPHDCSISFEPKRHFCGETALRGTQLVYPSMGANIDRRVCVEEDRAYENKFSNDEERSPTTDSTDVVQFTCPQCHSTSGSIPSLSSFRSRTPTPYLPYHMSHQMWQFVQCRECKHGSLLVHSHRALEPWTWAQTCTSNALTVWFTAPVVLSLCLLAIVVCVWPTQLADWLDRATEPTKRDF